MGGDISWVGYQYGPPQNPPASASWFHGDQWFNYVVPGNQDRAVFDTSFDPQANGMPFDVYFGDFRVPADPPGVPNAFVVPGGDASVGTLSIRKGDFSFHFRDEFGDPQGSLNAIDGMDIGAADTASLTIEGGVVKSQGGVLGFQDAASGKLVVTGSNTQLQVDSFTAADFNVGWHGHGELQISDGAHFSHQNGNTIIARGLGGEASAHVMGGGTTWQSNSIIIASFEGGGSSSTPSVGSFSVTDGAEANILLASTIGNGGHASLAVTSGSSLIMYGEAFAGPVVGSTADMLVSNAGSDWTINSNLYVGIDGEAQLVVSDYGHVAVTGSLRTGKQGTVDVSNNGSVNVGAGDPAPSGTIQIGPGGSLWGNGNLLGDVLVDGGSVNPGSSPGTLSVAGNYHQLPGSVLSLEVGGPTPGIEYDQLLATGNLRIEGPVQITFLDAFEPHVGDRFDLLQGGSLALTGPVTFHNVPPGLEMQSILDSTSYSLVVTAVPEPVGLLLGTIGFAAFCLGSRRRA